MDDTTKQAVDRVLRGLALRRSSNGLDPSWYRPWTIATRPYPLPKPEPLEGDAPDPEDMKKWYQRALGLPIGPPRPRREQAFRRAHVVAEAAEAFSTLKRGYLPTPYESDAEMVVESPDWRLKARVNLLVSNPSTEETPLDGSILDGSDPNPLFGRLLDQWIEVVEVFPQGFVRQVLEQWFAYVEGRLPEGPEKPVIRRLARIHLRCELEEDVQHATYLLARSVAGSFSGRARACYLTAAEFFAPHEDLRAHIHNVRVMALDIDEEDVNRTFALVLQTLSAGSKSSVRKSPVIPRQLRTFLQGDSVLYAWDLMRTRAKEEEK